MSVEVRPVISKKDLNTFIDLPWSLYDQDSPWVPPLKMAVKDLFKKSHPFFQTGKIHSFLAYQNNKPVGRISAITNEKYNQFHSDQTGFFGFFESIEDQIVAKALFDAVSAYLKAQGKTTILGPVNPSTNYEVGTLIDGYDDPPQIMMLYNKPFHRDFLESYGFTKAKDLIAFRLDLDFQMPEIIRKIAERTEKTKNITYRHVIKKNWEEEIKILHEIYNNAWEKNWGFVPMTDEEFLHTAQDLKMIIDERLINIVYVDNEPAGFIICLPDFNQVMKEIPSGKLLPTGIFKLLRPKKYINRCRVITLGVKQKFRRYGLETLLYSKMHKTLREFRYQDAELSWILEDNVNMIKPIMRMGASPDKTYRLFEMEIS